MRRYYALLIPLLLATLAGCGSRTEKLAEPGVSRTLADLRRETYRDVEYTLRFNIPADRDSAVTGRVEIALRLDRKVPLIVDFRGDAAEIHSVTLNGAPAEFRIGNEHIIIDRRHVAAGPNILGIDFTAADQSLNRRDDFLYTLLVPDRARTLFPCMDQPNLKAHFTLSLEVPAPWKAVANGAVESESAVGEGRKLVSFGRTEPLPTYLFSFVAGEFERVSATRAGREIAMFHRETDPRKIAQCPEVLDMVFESLEWMERYTAIPYPFRKYDLIVIPGFQYGGMEHTGATLYASRSIFLEENATVNNHLARAGLVAHETAHMWFGDFVTMEWFDEVWTKEVFATFFSSQIVRPRFPEIDHEVNFIRGVFPASYSEDRTAGSTAIKQPLANLSDAGLLYSQIIYSKSPIVMEKLHRKLGPEKFREGIREYLRTYGYGNATWAQLIAIFDRLTDEDLVAWSHVWVEENGMPTQHTERRPGKIVMHQSDPWGLARHWPQELTAWVVRPERIDTLHAAEGPFESLFALPDDALAVLPNADGRAYGYFPLESTDAQWLLANLASLPDPVARLSALITLYENLLNATVAPEVFLHAMVRYLEAEPNPLLYAHALGYTTGCFALYGGELADPALEQTLWALAHDQEDPQRRTQALQAYCSVARSPAALDQLFDLWADDFLAARHRLGEADLTSLAYNLSIRFPERAAFIRDRQRRRITNPDRRRQFDYIIPATDPSVEVRDSVFHALLVAENRRIEPWACTALSLLNHPLRGGEAIGRIRPALEEMIEIQRTGDIFLPRRWSAALLAPHRSAEAAAEVDAFFGAHPDYPLLLGTKIRQQADHLYRINR